MGTPDIQTSERRANSVRHRNAASTREGSLDGLRGVAALVVVLNHVMVTAATFANVANRSGRADAMSFEWWLSYTPLHVFWGGTEAVFIFFILSGYVLTGPTEKAAFTWRVYYPKRLIRLYIPVWASLVVAGLSALLVVRHEVHGGSWWVNDHGPLDVGRAAVSGLLLGPIDFLNNPLWSLAWEMWFSLLLPLYIFLCRWSTKSAVRTIGVIVLLGAVMAAGSLVDSNALRYLPMFALGILMFMHRAVIASRAATLDSIGWAWPAVLCSAIVLLTSYWMAQGSPAIPSAIVSVARSAQVAGAALFVVVALHWGAARRALQMPAIKWLGSRSFSLYLTHDSVVISTTLILGGTPPLWLTLSIAIPIALLLAELFFRVIEAPSHKLSRRVGERIHISAAR